jgi:hypothetical protein
VDNNLRCSEEVAATGIAVADATSDRLSDSSVPRGHSQKMPPEEYILFLFCGEQRAAVRNRVKL